ncbi:glutaredoxin family protein [Pseudomonas viridiflava]|uniref:glutaredoxin family protein n=1 Tax=Pseudomonas syringae group TaxID=136849 RepID=UPI000F0107FA|nr:glutaredoxin family protein [Pseudomonas viridiflava]MEE4084032.1 glutaredoxin family protein [Pseudomonas viridiflava]MEE4129173.1 glutaredoxin family protein [Pseudomonas viridiflava]MEE4229930.1 glutaredoxin family protein [Pseudomonas viridiflava]QVI86900.1 glutaredoxin family protein [Pseudomonas viridiflava]
MLMRTLKKVALIMLVVVIYQNWGKIENFVNPPPASVAQSYSQAKVVMYATEWCGYCKQTRRFLDSKGIPYQEYDIEKSEEGRKAYEALGGRGIPLIDVNGTLIRGFAPEDILAALK